MNANARPGRAGETEMEPQGAADLCRRIAEDAAAQAAELLRLAAEKASARIAQAEAEAARLREEAVLRGRAAAAQEETRLLAKVRLDARRNELAERERLIEEVMGRVRRRIAGLRLEPGYAGVLKRLAAEAVLELGEREAEILLPPGRQARAGRKRSRGARAGGDRGRIRRRRGGAGPGRRRGRAVAHGAGLGGQHPRGEDLPERQGDPAAGLEGAVRVEGGAAATRRRGASEGAWA